MNQSTGPRLISLLIVLIGWATASAAEQYPPPPEASPQPGVPTGTVTHTPWKNSSIFPGTEREYWIYVPAEYDPKTPACVMIFQDGDNYQKPLGEWHVPIVFDNLIFKKEMPVTIGIFINPGVIPARDKSALPRVNRSYEYDSPTDHYARFLLEEILPEVGKHYNLVQDGNGRALCGFSSGGCCAFTAAWFRPHEFSRVVSFIGSFADLRGDDHLPALIRKTEPKAIRVFQQDGSSDLNIYAGNWWLANQQMDSALEFAGYEHQFIKGEGGHNARQGGSTFPDALRFIWKDYPAPVKKPVNPRQPVMQIVDPAQEWQVVSEGHKFTEGPAPDKNGNVYFTDIPNSRIFKVDAAGKTTLFAENTNQANGLMAGGDGKLYACQKNSGNIVAYDSDAKETVVCDGIVGCNDLVIAHNGAIYVTQPIKKTVWFIAPDTHGKKIVDQGIAWPNGVTLTPDQTQLIVADTHGRNLWIFTIGADGSLTNKQPYFTCDLPWDASDSGADGLTVDTEGRVYAATLSGIQIFDQMGRVNAIIDKPQDAWLANLKFGGKDLDTLYVACGDKVYKRKLKSHGFFTIDAPFLPPIPQL
jgi:sugar lactone lactonase YvrE/enterochelin esterase-like enzyme